MQIKKPVFITLKYKNSCHRSEVSMFLCIPLRIHTNLTHLDTYDCDATLCYWSTPANEMITCLSKNEYSQRRNDHDVKLLHQCRLESEICCLQENKKWINTQTFAVMQ